MVVEVRVGRDEQAVDDAEPPVYRPLAPVRRRGTRTVPIIVEPVVIEDRANKRKRLVEDDVENEMEDEDINILEAADVDVDDNFEAVGDAMDIDEGPANRNTRKRTYWIFVEMLFVKDADGNDTKVRSQKVTCKCGCLAKDESQQLVYSGQK